MIIDKPDAKHIPYLRALWKEAFGDTDEFLDLFFETAFSPDRCRTVTIDGECAAALYFFDCICGGGKIAYIYAVATAEKHRGKGLCTRLMEDTHKHLKALGYRGAILVPGSKKLFDFYEKMGYRTACHIGEFTCEANCGTVPLTKLGRSEYAALRRRLLPEGGVIQEGENLDFLITQAELYLADGTLIAARRENDLLNCLEILGDTSLAPAVVNSLGCRTGKFRTPPQSDISSRPFAMYLPLTDGSAPAYLAFAFD